MKLVFFSIVLIFTLLTATYVTLRGWQALQPVGSIRVWYLSANIALFALMMISMMMGNSLHGTFAKVLTFTGYTYMIVMLYLLLSFLVVDVVRISNWIFHFSSDALQQFRLWALLGSATIILIALVVGNYKFNHPAIVNMQLGVNNTPQNKTLKIVAVSDIHLGVSIDKKKLKEYVNLINLQKPDIVLMAGDISDRSTQPLVDQHMEEELRQIIAPLGVYAISGNHEYYSENPYSTGEFLQNKCGITLLRDSVALVNNSFYVVGRDDKTNLKRRSLAAVMAGLDHSKPIILLDHQPFHLEEAQHNGVDLQISGHTHDGQIFPGNLIVKKMYELGAGFMQKGNTHYYVSSGLGLWGPQYRIGTQSEIGVITMKF